MALTNEYIGRPFPGLPTTNEIIDLCHKKGGGFNGLTYPPNGTPIAYIKYGYSVTVGEMRTQLYVLNAFKQMVYASGPDSGSLVKVPEIYHAFECEGQTYIVMEYVDGETVGAQLDRSSAETRDTIYDQMAKAISQLLRVPIPSNQRPGPVGGGCIQHYFFQDDVAVQEYQSVDQLQHHINRVCTTEQTLLVYRQPHHHADELHMKKQVLKLGRVKDQVDFSKEELCLCYSDITGGNFLITKAGQTYVIDFEHAGFLPRSFMSLVLHGSAKPLGKCISEKLSIAISPNLYAMSRASYFFKISANIRIGKSRIQMRYTLQDADAWRVSINRSVKYRAIRQLFHRA